jgi:hypothetical protein
MTPLLYEPRTLEPTTVNLYMHPEPLTIDRLALLVGLDPYSSTKLLDSIFS